MKQLVAIHRICVCRCCTDRSLLCWIIVWRGCGGTCQNLGIFGIFGQFGRFWPTWAILDKFGKISTFWQFLGFSQFWSNFKGFCRHIWPFGKMPFGKIWIFLAIWAIFGNFGNFGGFWVNLAVLAFRHFRPFLANLAVFGPLRQFWQFQTNLAISEIFPILVKF